MQVCFPVYRCCIYIGAVARNNTHIYIIDIRILDFQLYIYIDKFSVRDEPTYNISRSQRHIRKMVHCVKSVYLFAARLGERLFLKTNLVKKELAPWISRAAWTSSMRILRGLQRIRTESGPDKQNPLICFQPVNTSNSSHVTSTQ